MTPRAIVIDTDPGQDDAIALLLAFARGDALDVRLVATVAGNTTLAQTTANALRVRELAGHDAPVAAGMEAPMVLALETAEYICGPDGLAGANLPAPLSSAAPGHAVERLISLARASAPKSLTICALGPLSNVAMALRLAPDISGAIESIVLMGGALGLGNVTPAAEFNIHVDPHAAEVVFASGLPIVMFGLHATHQALARPRHIERLAGLGTATGRAAHGMLTRPRPGGFGTSAHPMHDPCVVAWLLWPELFAGRDCFVEIECEGRLRGRTTIDWNGRSRKPPNAFVVGEVRAEPLFDRMIDALALLP